MRPLDGFDRLMFSAICTIIVAGVLFGVYGLYKKFGTVGAGIALGLVTLYCIFYWYFDPDRHS